MNEFIRSGRPNLSRGEVAIPITIRTGINKIPCINLPELFVFINKKHTFGNENLNIQVL